MLIFTHYTVSETLIQYLTDDIIKTQVKVVKRGEDLQIKISCKKKSGLLIALMEVMESSGLVFSYVDVSCNEDIHIKALGNQVWDHCYHCC